MTLNDSEVDNGLKNQQSTLSTQPGILVTHDLNKQYVLVFNQNIKRNLFMT